MSEELDTANRYRQRAEELRLIAEDETSKEARSTLWKIAADYERMAESLEAIDRANTFARALKGQPLERTSAQPYCSSDNRAASALLVLSIDSSDDAMRS